MINLSHKRITYRICAVIILSVFVIGALVVNMALSYLISSKSRDNIFTIGIVRLDLSEENYPDDPEDRILPPKGVIDKDPKIKNIGTNNAYVFLKITVPLCEVRIVDEQTKKINRSGKEYREVFNLISSSDNAKIVLPSDDFTVFDTGAFSYDPEWILIRTEENTEKHTHSYTFGYTSLLTASDAQSETSTIFDKLQLRNILEGELDKEVLQKVTVSAYGIQADELPDSIEISDTDNISESELKAIFSLYEKQEG